MSIESPAHSTPALGPVGLGPNQFRHFYRGGGRIATLRGIAAGAVNQPEDWVASTTTRFDQAEQGLSRLPDGRFLRDAIQQDPPGWLGPRHVKTFGVDLNLLVKLLDAGQRLVVHVHPNRAFAARHLGCAHGKTEAWIVLATDGPDAAVYLGWRHAVEADEVRSWVEQQDVEAMLGALNVVPVRPGDAILVPAGLPHAIGAGVLLVELQEPTDFSVLLEWRGFAVDGPADGHLGLGFDLALQSLDRTACPPDRLAALHGPGDDGSVRARLLPVEADPFFRAERIREGARLEPSIAVLVVIQGSGRLTGDAGVDLPLRRGDTIVVPFAAGPTTVSGNVELLRCLPPAPSVLN